MTAKRNQSRRQFLVRSGAVGAALVGLGGVADRADAQSSPEAAVSEGDNIDSLLEGLSDGQTLSIPQGSYRIGSPTVSASNVTIEGNGSTLSMSGSNDINFTGTNWSFGGFAFDVSNGADMRIVTGGRKWRLHNLAWDGPIGSGYVIYPRVDSGGSGLIDKIYLGDGLAANRADSAIFTYDDTDGTVTVRNSYFYQTGIYGAYTESPVEQTGVLNVESSYFENTYNAAVRTGTPGLQGHVSDTVIVYDSRSETPASPGGESSNLAAGSWGARGVWAFHDGVTVSNTHITNPYGPAYTTAKGGSITVDGGAYTGGVGENVSGTESAGSNPQTTPPSGVPTSAAAAATGSSNGTIPSGSSSGSGPTGSASRSGAGAGRTGGLAGEIVDQLLPGESEAQTISNNIIETTAVAVLLAAAWTPIPTNFDLAMSLHSDAQGLLWTVIALTFLTNVISVNSSGLDGNFSYGSLRNWAISTVLALNMFQLANLWLELRRGISYWFLQDVGQVSFETTLTALALIIVLVVFALVNARFAISMLVVSLGAALFIVFATPFIGVLTQLRCSRVNLVSKLSDGLFKFYFLVTVVTLPIVMGAGAAFTIDIGPELADQLSTLPNADQFMTQGVETLIVLGAKVGSIAVGGLGAHFLYSSVASTLSVPRPEVVVRDAAPDRGPREMYRGGRDRVVGAKRSSQDFVRGARGKESVEEENPRTTHSGGAAVRQTVMGFRDGSWRGKGDDADDGGSDDSEPESGGRIRRWASGSRTISTGSGSSTDADSGSSSDAPDGEDGSTAETIRDRLRDASSRYEITKRDSEDSD